MRYFSYLPGQRYLAANTWEGAKQEPPGIASCEACGFCRANAGCPEKQHFKIKM